MSSYLPSILTREGKPNTYKPEAQDCLKLPRLPARLDASQAAVYLGFAPHDIPVLVAAKLLKPLGKPAPNGQKYFALCDLEAYRNDREWLHAASEVINRHWQVKNGTCPPPPRPEKRGRKFSKQDSSAKLETAELSRTGELMKAE
jgi:hypothetical protein